MYRYHNMDDFQFRAREYIEIVSCEYPCRSDILRRLYIDLSLGSFDAALPASIFIYGDHGTGKTAVLTEFLFYLEHLKTVTIDCVECYTSRIIYETVLNQLFDHSLEPANNYASYRKCDNARDFLDALNELSEERTYVIRFDDAQRMRDMEANVLAIFLRLRECTRLNICCMFVSSLPLEKLFPVGSFPMPIVVHWPNYTQKEVLSILVGSYPAFSRRLYDHYVHSKPIAENVEKTRLADIIDGLERSFYENFFNLFLNTFFRTCRDLNELRIISQDCFTKYCEPIMVSNVDMNDVRSLYKHIASTLKATVNTIYRRVDNPALAAPPSDNTSSKPTSHDGDQPRIPSVPHQQLELPYYAKYLLIAAFLASHNDVRLDKRLFVKHHGKQRKTQQSIRAKQIVSEKMATQLGPKTFPIDRLMAIFYAIVEEKVPLTCNLMAQIPSLVRLKLLNFVSGEANIMDGGARLQCIVSLDFIVLIGRNVGFNVRQYLGDFM